MNPTNDLFEVSSTYWLIVLALSLCVTAGYVWRFAVGKTEGSVLWNRVTAVAAALMLCLTAVDGLNFAYRGLSASYRLPGVVAVIAIAAWLTWLHLSHSKTPRSIFRRRPAAWLLLVSSVVLVAWSSHRFQGRLLPPVKKHTLVLRTPGKKNVVHEFVAITDRNHPIPVFRLDPDEQELPASSNEINGQIVDIAQTTIQRAPASPLSNCHGWLFLGAEFLISGEAVQRILDDNGYEFVTEPSPGDVIIYWNDNREILHSGLVRGVLNDGTVIIESKWGTEGIFLHSPEGQPYSANFEYYRSPRSDHRVKIVPADELPMDE